MSYILDALKKSEQERKLGDLPDIYSDHQLLQKSHERNLAVYTTLALIFILVIILLLLGFYYVTDPVRFENKLNSENAIADAQLPSTYNNIDNSDEEFVATADDEETLDSSSVEIIRPSQERRDVLQEQYQQDLQKEADLKREYESIFIENSDVNSSTKNESSKLNEVLDSADGDVNSEPEESESNTVLAEPNWDDYESIAELNPSLKQKIPSIIVSTHIFSSVKSFRKVTVNGFSVQSGAEISDGLVVEHILEDGVIFSFEGIYFRMKALEEWEG